MDSVLIPFGAQVLALTREEFDAALERGRDTAPTTVTRNEGEQERLLTAEEMEERAGVPASWFLEQARRGELPHVRLGKYVRFRLTEVLAVSTRGKV